MTMTTMRSVASVYRELARLIRVLPEKQQRVQGFEQLRKGFRKHENISEDQLPKLIADAEERIKFLKIITPRTSSSIESGQASGTKRWVYKNGQPIDNSEGTSRYSNNKAPHSNWDGKNLDPCSVKRHYTGLKRAGFINNSHAKGIF